MTYSCQWNQDSSEHGGCVRGNILFQGDFILWQVTTDIQLILRAVPLMRTFSNTSRSCRDTPESSPGLILGKERGLPWKMEGRPFNRRQNWSKLWGIIGQQILVHEAPLKKGKARQRRYLPGRPPPPQNQPKKKGSSNTHDFCRFH